MKEQLFRLSEIEKFLIRLERDIASLDIVQEITYEDNRANVIKAIKELELAHATELAQLKKIEANYFSGTTSLQDEYKRLKRVVDELDTQMIEAYDLLEAEEEKLRAYEAAVREQGLKDKDKESARENYNAQVLRYESEKAELFASLPADYQKGYLRGLKAFRGDPVAQYVVGCNKCGAKLPSKIANLIGHQSINCDGCHRLLLGAQES